MRPWEAAPCVRLALLLAILVLATPAAAYHQGHRDWSTIPDGSFAVLPGDLREFVASDGTPISYAVHMPAVPAGTRVPVILSAGPYFGHTEEPVDVPSSVRYTGFLVDNFVSHGYAVVAASVRGTGLSGGCMELMSEREARDLDELVTFLANEPWSTGAVAMTGKSYDGGTPWMVAQLGNPYLKTIVPLQGVTDQGALLYPGGAAQDRAPIFHSVVYWPFGLDMASPTQPGMYRPLDKRVGNLVCPELAEGQASALASAYTGETSLPYWEERAWRERTIANYDGSVFIVHGLRDWNVLPSQVVPFFGELPQEKKLLLGQWEHQYPDEGVFTQRNDFAAMLKAWFDSELKGLPVDTGPTVLVADGNTGAWRAATTWPDATGSRTFHLTASRAFAAEPQAPFQVPVATPAGAMNAACTSGETPNSFRAKLSEGFTVSGLPEARLVFDPPVAGSVTVSLCAGMRLVSIGSRHVLDELVPSDEVRVPQEVVIAMEPAESTFFANTTMRFTVAFEGGGVGTMGSWAPTGPGAGVLVGGEITLPTR